MSKSKWDENYDRILEEQKTKQTGRHAHFEYSEEIRGEIKAVAKKAFTDKIEFLFSEERQDAINEKGALDRSLFHNDPESNLSNNYPRNFYDDSAVERQQRPLRVDAIRRAYKRMFDEDCPV